ncbi:ribonucleoside triphosphate reductase [Rubellicoccus peritrichatus]|uniref:Ribonucleoside triphosphate reductase n=1 Tax=Rubellicoccus peritrichatus TaxID=3080537 RepID=A0AAQ3L955_9BACT|nr:ribonucleoside triphosphate reductase [Puniceicoccus sp. CR14]WOO40224.1 ribonucleoside triphosphate reductase [Puniceicoccus sp. CR14]
MVTTIEEIPLFDPQNGSSAIEAHLSLNNTEIQQVCKRDGRKVRFEPMRIVKAFQRAGDATSEFNHDQALWLALQVVNQCTDKLTAKTPSVEEIQDIAEEVLLQSPFRKTAKAYIIYRDQHARRREMQNKTKTEIVEQYLRKLDWQVRENSNMAYSLQGLNNYISSGISQSFWLNEVYTPQIQKAHEGGDFHIHDTNQLSVYCVGWDLYQLLQEGFRGVPGKVESAPARHLRSALGQIVNFFYTLQGEAAGAQAFSSFDTLLAPFIRYDNLSYEDVRQIVQEFIFNVNVPTRVGFQSPFTNITLDLQCPRHYRDQPVLRGGEFMAERYGDFQEEMDLLNRAFFDIMTEGDAGGRLFSFPIPTINLTKGFDWENPNLRGLWEMTGKFGIPYFSNFINSDMSPDDARSMCCRLRIDNTQLERRGGGLFGAHPLTGSIGVVTINLPRIAHRTRSQREFFTRLGKLMDLARNSLEIKRKLLEQLTESGLYPYTQYYLRDMKKRHGVYWKNHFSTIGLVGMNEACLNLFGRNIATPKGSAFAAKTLKFMRDRLISYQQETGHHYNLEASPAEGTSMRLALKDQEKYPGIVAANSSEVLQGGVPYYTNSTHLPVNFSDDPFEILSLQEETQCLYTGGTVIHLFLGERVSDPTAVREFVKAVASNYRLPYFSLTPTFSVCPQHGYIAGEHHDCPHCGTESEVYSRIVGYLRPLSQWNDGKQAEFRHRSRLQVDSDQLPHQRPETLLQAQLL